MQGKMKININILLTALLIVTTISAVYFYTRLSNLEEMQIQLLRQGQYNRVDKSGRVSDPYIKREVKNTITKNSAGMLDCYRDFLKKNSKIPVKGKKAEKRDGKVTIDWHIDKNGTVLSPQIVRSELKDESFKNCLVEKIRRWRFPPPPAGLNKYVDHTFNFIDKE